MIERARQMENAVRAAGDPSHGRAAGIVRGAVTITVLFLIVAGTSVVAALVLSGCGTGLFPPGDRTTDAAGTAIPGANEDAFVTTDGPAIARVRIITLDGVFVLFDAAIPKNDLADRKPAYVAWWNDFAAQKRFVFGRLIETQADVGHALLNLERDLDVDLDSLVDDSPELNQAIVNAAAEAEDGIDWEPATYGTAVQIMGFPAPQATGDPDMDRLLFANGGVDESYGNLCRPAFKTTMELLPSPGPLPGPYMPITLAIRLSGCGYGEPAVDESRAVSEDHTPPEPSDAQTVDILLFYFDPCFNNFGGRCDDESTVSDCDGPCCDDPCCDDPVCCGDEDCGGCSGPCCVPASEACICNDNNECTIDRIDSGTGQCVHAPRVGGCTSDGNQCTDDTCVSGVCEHLPNNCNDRNACTDDICQNGVCTHPMEPAGTECRSDENPCTDDVCVNGSCTHPPSEDGSTCGDDRICCNGECCAEVEACCDGFCQISTCSFTVNPVSGCPGATVDLTLQDGVCEPDCEFMNFPAVSGIPNLTVTPPGSISCGGPPADRTFSVAISTNAPAGEITFTLTGETSATACSQTVRVRVEPVLETISLSPAGTLVLGKDLAVNYEVSTFTGTGFDSVEMEIKNSSGQVVFANQGLPAGSGSQSAVWPGGKWNQSPHAGAFANPLNGPYQITLTGRKVDCPDQIQSSSIATKLVLEADVQDAIPPGAVATRSSGLEDMLDALKIVLKLGAGETVFSGAGVITVTGANPDTKEIKVDAAGLNTLANGAYEVLFRDLRDEIGNFADEDGVLSNGIQPIKFNLELR